MTQFLRAEAQPLVRWDSMYETQQKAFRDIVMMLSEAVSQLPMATVKSSGHEGADESRLEKRSTQLAFLSGNRGTGKTSVMASLRKACSHRSEPNDLSGFPPEILEPVNQLRSHLVWLEPLDMEVSIQSSNLLAAILARIEAKAQAMVPTLRGTGPTPSEWGGMLDNEYRDPLLELQRFQANMSIAWDTAWDDRRPQLDPDNLAVESMRFEKSRLSLVQTLDRVLNNFAAAGVRSSSKVTNPLFVLPVDDFDLCPSSCLELLRVLRMISVPRLFFLVLGDLKVADLVLNLKFSADLASAAEGVLYSDFLAIQLKEVAAAASEVTANALRKLIPPAQRVSLLHPTLKEALNFRPIGHAADDPHLYELLMRSPVYRWNYAAGQLEQQGNLLGQMLPKSDFAGEPSTPTLDTILDGPRLSSLSLLQTSSRSISDLWYRVRRLTQRLPKATDSLAQSDRERWQQELCVFVGQLCRESWAQDPGVPLEQRREVPAAFEPSSVESWNLDSLWLSVDTTVSRAVTIETSASARSSTWVEFQLNRVNNWSLSVLSDPGMTGPGTSGRSTLSSQTTGAVILFHDLVIDRQESASLLHRNSAYWFQWAVTRWRRGLARVEFGWPVAPGSRFWNQSWFVYFWNSLLSVMSTELANPTLGPSLTAFHWIHLGTQSLAWDENLGLMDVSPERLPWEKLFGRLVELIPEPHKHSHFDWQRRDWLAKVGSMFMPEMALNLPSRVKPPQQLIDFWMTESLTIARLRAIRLAQLVASGLDDKAEELRNETPKHFSENVFRPSKRSVEALSKTLPPNVQVDVEIDRQEQVRRIVRSQHVAKSSSRGTRLK